MDYLFPQGVCGCCGKPPFVEGENYVVTEAGCWEWIASKDLGGYGRLTYRHIRWPAHRLSYVLATGEDPGEKPVHHVCETKACINPDHLEAIDQGAHFNGHRSPEWYAKMDRSNHPRKLELSDVEEMRRLYATGGYTFKRLGELFGVRPQYAHKVVRFQRRIDA